MLDLSKHLLATVASLLLLAQASQAAQLYHSQANDGSADGVCIPIGGPVTAVNLFLSHGAVDTVPSTAKCDGSGGEIEGEEVCMYDLLLETEPDVFVEAFTPEPGQGIAAKVESNRVRIIGGDPTVGHLGPIRIGTLELSAAGPGELLLSEGRFLDTRLNTQSIASVGGIAYAEFDGDGDQICDGVDVCPEVHNVLPIDDLNDDGVPRECQCGDPNGSGFYESADLLLIFQCLQNPGTPECNALLFQGDANGSGAFESADLLLVYRVMTGQLHGGELTCPARMDGFIP